MVPLLILGSSFVQFKLFFIEKKLITKVVNQTLTYKFLQRSFSISWAIWITPVVKGNVW